MDARPLNPTRPCLLIISLVCSLCLLLASSCAHRHPTTDTASAKPRGQAKPPKCGEPINITELVDYFETESLALLREGKLTTNLLQQPRAQVCSLKLRLPPQRSLTSAELPQTTEMGVAVVGRIGKAGGKPRLTPTASGFFLTDSGALATCWHVVNWNPLIALTVMTRDGRVFPVRQLLAVSTNYDLAILQVEGTNFTALPLAPNVQQGAPVWVLGHPFPWYYMLTSGIASGYYTLDDPGGQLTILDVTAEFANGSSGAPVFNEFGAVVAVAKFRLTVGIPGTPQMATKGCIPSAALLSMIHTPTP